MTVREWIAERSELAPEALTQRMLTSLGPDADADEARTADLCLAAAVRSLDAILAGSRFDRGAAIDLLAVDALTTLAFEHASAPDARGDLSDFARRSAITLGQLTAQRV